MADSSSQPGFDLPAANALLQDVFAPWIRALNIHVEALHDEGADLRMPFSESLCREGGIVCGQAFMALADTAMVFAVASASNAYRPMATVELTTHMMRPVSNSDVLAKARILRLGKRMAFGQITLTADGDDRPAVSATTAYALL